VFERTEVAKATSPEHPKAYGPGDLKPRSAILIKLAGPESSYLVNSPAVSFLILVANSARRLRPVPGR
jgi:hypothetical protein